MQACSHSSSLGEQPRASKLQRQGSRAEGDLMNAARRGSVTAFGIAVKRGRALGIADRAVLDARQGFKRRQEEAARQLQESLKGGYLTST